jgi:parallel beta-helix repeat protein
MTKLKQFFPLLTIGIILVGLGLISKPLLISLKTSNETYVGVPNSALTPHAPISIDGNVSLDSFCTVGDGSFTTPYIIENYEIEAITAHGIDIMNTNAYLVIRNCVIENGSSNNFHGISLDNCSNVNISGNIANNNSNGITLPNSYNLTLTGNTVSNNILYGFYMYRSHNNTLSGNTASNNNLTSFYLNLSNNNTIINCEASNTALGIFLYNCVNNTLSGNNVFNNDYGVYLQFGTVNTTLSGNIVTNNDYGIYIYMLCEMNRLSGNIVTNNNYGIYLYGSSNNTLWDNTANLNNVYGIYMNSTNNNTIWKNKIVGNLYSNAKSSSDSVNFWDNGAHGNYWGDYYTRYPSATNDGTTWNTPYQINGSVADTDHYPLVLFPPTAPTLQNITPNPDIDGNITLGWNSVSEATIYRVYRNTVLITTTTGQTHIATVISSEYVDTGLINGTYYYVVAAINGTGPSAISNCVSVQVSIPPNFTTTTTTNTTTSTSASTNTTTSTNGTTVQSTSSSSIDGIKLPLFVISGTLIAVVLVHKKKKTINFTA